MMNDKNQRMSTCCICHRQYSGYGNNALPVMPGRCCDRCNREIVVMMRWRLMRRR